MSAITSSGTSPNIGNFELMGTARTQDSAGDLGGISLTPTERMVRFLALAIQEKIQSDRFLEPRSKPVEL